MKSTYPGGVAWNVGALSVLLDHIHTVGKQYSTVDAKRKVHDPACTPVAVAIPRQWLLRSNSSSNHYCTNDPVCGTTERDLSGASTLKKDFTVFESLPGDTGSKKQKRSLLIGRLIA